MYVCIYVFVFFTSAIFSSTCGFHPKPDISDFKSFYKKFTVSLLNLNFKIVLNFFYAFESDLMYVCMYILFLVFFISAIFSSTCVFHPKPNISNFKSFYNKFTVSLLILYFNLFLPKKIKLCIF